MYIEPGAGAMLLQAVGGLLIAWVATLGRVREFFRRALERFRGWR